MTGIFILSGKMEFRKIGYGITFLNCVFQMKYYCGNTDENSIEEISSRIENKEFSCCCQD
jgi:translation elongation factor EF-1beta